MAKVWGDVEARLIWRAPGTQSLIGVYLWRGDCAEKVHPPLRALGLALVYVEDAQRNGNGALPRFGRLVEHRRGAEAISRGIRHKEVVKGRAGSAVL